MKVAKAIIFEFSKRALNKNIISNLQLLFDIAGKITLPWEFGIMSVYFDHKNREAFLVDRRDGCVLARNPLTFDFGMENEMTRRPQSGRPFSIRKFQNNFVTIVRNCLLFYAFLMETDLAHFSSLNYIHWALF